jgi:hypothetical protein
MNYKSKNIKKTKKDWRDENATPSDKLNMGYALAAFLIETKQENKLPAPGIATVREIIPYLAEEDERWLNILANRVTTTGKPIYTDLCHTVRNVLGSQKLLRQYLAHVKDRMSK